MNNRIREKPLRVVHVTQSLEMGGQEKLLVEFARHANRRKFDLRFVCLGSRGALAGDIEECGWPVEHLDLEAGFRPDLIFRLAQLFRRWQADVVHTHEDRSLIHGATAAGLARTSAVMHSRHGQSLGMTPRQTTLVNLASRFVHHFVCVSRDSARLSMRHGVFPGKVTTIWNGIDLEQFPYSGPNPTGPVVCVARLIPEKSIETLIRAALLASYQDPHLRVEIAGDGVCMLGLRQLVAELGLDERVRLLGEVRDVSRLLARARVFVLPSRTEGISLTILEAMARGLPVVATRVGGNVEVVAEGETGLLVSAGRPAELAAALVELNRDWHGCRALGRAGRQRVERHFDIRQMVANYEALYLARCRPAPLSIRGDFIKLRMSGLPTAAPATWQPSNLA